MANVLLSDTVSDQDEARVSGALVYIYDGDGLATLYDSMAQEADNPVTTDEDGYWEAWVPEERYYTEKVYWGGRQRYVIANVLAGDPPVGPNSDPNLRADLAEEDGSALVGFIQSGDEAVSRTVQAKLRDMKAASDYTFDPASLATPPDEYVEYGNWAFGADVLASNVGGMNNIAVGSGALAAAENVRSSIAIGNEALQNVVGDGTGVAAVGTFFAEGDSNIAVGDFALRDTTTGYENLAIGSYALRNNTTGKWNIAVGHQSQILGTTGECNVSVGDYNLTVYSGSNSLAIGWAALEVLASGSNCAVGHISQNATTSGTLNTSLGAETLALNTTGDQNTAIGQEVLKNLNTGDNNTGVGAYALGGLDGAATNNTGVGKDALVALVTGDGNTALGSGAGNTVNNFANTISIGLGVNATKSDQTVVGRTDQVEFVTYGVLRIPTTFEVGGLPSAATMGANAHTFVTDANATTWGSIVAGGGSNGVPVYSDGTNWRIG